MKGMKRLIASILAFAIMIGAAASPYGDILFGVLGNLSVEAGAETYGNFEYSILDDGTVKITNYNGSAADVKIPSEIYGKSVTSIGNITFYGCTSLTSITIPDSVTGICGNLFTYCSSLTSITVSENNEYYISDNGILFNKNKSELIYYPVGKTDKSYSIPDSVTTIGDCAFYCCSGLTSITIPDGVTSIGNYAFYNCSGITSIAIPDGVASIGDGAFNRCSNLTSINIPDGVTSIGQGTFSGCSTLTSIKIPDSVMSIEWGSFYGCKSLTSIEIPDSVTNIDYRVFSCCYALMSITVSENNEHYISDDGILFSKNETELICYPAGKTDKSYTIPNSVTNIGRFAFDGCSSLTSITIPDNVKSIGNDAFHGCSGLTSIAIPDNVKSIGNDAFHGCSGLTSIAIPGGVTNIGRFAFSGCTGLTSITLPNSVTSIGNDAFDNCSGLTSITIPDSVTSIASDVFYGCTGLTSITIPDSVTSIASYAFSGCTGLTSITIPDSVTSIASSAFSGCNSSLVINGYTNSVAEQYAKDKGFTFKSIGYITPTSPKKSTYTIKVIDQNGSSINNASISDSKQCFYAVNGIFTVKNPSGTTLTVSASGCADKSITLRDLSVTGVNTIKLGGTSSEYSKSISKIYYSENSDIDTVYKNGKINTYIESFKAMDVLYYTKTIDLKKTSWGVASNYDFYLYCVSDADNVSSYSVYAGNELLTTSAQPKICINTSEFNEGETLKLVVKFNDNTQKEYKVNLNINDNTKKDASFEISGDSVSFGLPENLSWLGPSNISLPKIPVYLKVTGDEIRVGAGVSKDVLDSDDKFFGFKESFDKLKDNLKNANIFFKAKTLAELKTKYMDQQSKKKKSFLPGFKDGLDITFVGCGYAKYNGADEGTSVGFNLIITADYGVSFSHQFFVWVIPVVVDIKGGISAQCTISSSINGIGTDHLQLEDAIDLEIKPYFKPYAGIGIDKVANIGVYGKLELPINVCLYNSDSSKMGLNSVDIYGEFGIRASALWFSHELSVFSGRRNLFTRPTNTIAATISDRTEIMESYSYISNNLTQLVTNTDSYTPSAESASITLTGNEEGLIAENMSKFSSPDILVTDDMTILAALNTDTQRGINNQSYIVTAIYKDGAWSEAKAVNDTNYSEFAPKLYKSGDDIFLIYQQATKEFTDDADIDEVTNNIGIAVSKLNPDTLEFENTNVVYSTDGYSFAPEVCDGYAVWFDNTDGNPFGNTANNSLILYDGAQTATVASDLGYVISADVGTLSGTAYIAYTLDADGNYETADDIQLYIVDTNGGKPILVKEGTIGTFSFEEFNGGSLVWNYNGKLNYLSTPDSTAVKATDTAIPDDFGMLDDSTIYYFGSTGSSNSCLYLMKYDGKAWSAPYEYSSCTGNIAGISNDGNNIFYSVCDSEGTSTVYKLYFERIIASKDIRLNGVDFDSDYLVSTSKIPLNLSLTNNGSETVQTMAFRIADEQMNTVNVYTLSDMLLKPGETSEYTIVLNSDDNCINGKFSVIAINPSVISNLSDEQLNSDLSKDKTPDNNKYSVDFTKSDLAVGIDEFLFGENHSLMFTVSNNTDIASGGTLKITDSNGTELYNEHFEELDFNGAKTVELSAEDMIPDGCFGTEITATVICDNSEYYEYNNTASQWLTHVFPEEIETFTATEISPTGLTLNWSGLSEECSVSIEQYADGEWAELATIADASVGQYVLSELDEADRYYFRIRAFKDYGSENGFSNYSSTLVVCISHDYAEWTVTKAATCTEDGSKYRTCTACGETETETIDALGHSYSTKVIAPTCTEQGYTLHTCSRCDDSYKDTYINAKGHNYVTSVVKPTLDAEGYTLHKCSVCGYSYKDNYTAKRLPPSQVTGLTYGARSADYVSLKWNKDSNADGYLVEYLSGDRFVKLTDKTNGSAVSYKVTGLEPGTLYKFRVRSYINVNNARVYGTYSEVLRVRTLPTAMTGLTLGARTDTSISLKWDKNESANGAVVEMYSGGAWITVATKTSNTAVSHKITGLKASTAYKFRVRAYINDEEGRIYSVYNVTLNEATAPSAVKNFRNTIAAKTALRFNWDRNTTADGYCIEMVQDGKWVQVTKIESNATIAYAQLKLNPGTKYSFRIRAYKQILGKTIYGAYNTISATTAS